MNRSGGPTDRGSNGGTVVLTVASGAASGRRVTLGPGRSVVGRDPGCDLVLDDPGVSRRHAEVSVDGGTVLVEDLRSRNGTLVNGARLQGRLELRQGDEVRLGGAVLQVTPPDRQPSGEAGHPRRKVSIGRVALVGGLANVAILAAGVVIQFITDWSGGGAWLTAALAGMVASLVQVAKEALTKAPDERAGRRTAEPTPQGATPVSSERQRPVSTHRRAPLGAALLVAVLVIGGGGLALAYGVGTVSSYITGNQSGMERLAETVTGEFQGMTVTVSSVERTRNFMRVEASVRNDLPNTVRLPLFGNATLRGADGSTLEADAFRSNWSDAIAPGQLSRGTIVFPGHLPEGTTTASLAFSTVFEQGFEGPNSIVLEGIRLERTN